MLLFSTMPISTNEDDHRLYHEPFRVGNGLLSVEHEIQAALKPGQRAWLSLSVLLQNPSEPPIWNVSIQAMQGNGRPADKILMSQLPDVDDALAEVVWAFAARSVKPKLEMDSRFEKFQKYGFLVKPTRQKKQLKAAKKRSRIKPTA